LVLPAYTATIAFKDIPSTNVVNSTDQLLLNSNLGGGNYATRTITVSALPSNGSQTPWTSDINGAQHRLTNTLQLAAGTWTNDTYAAVSPSVIGPSESTYNLLQYFPGKDITNTMNGGWFFTQGTAALPNGDTDVEKQYTWGFNSVNGSVQNTNEHSSTWSLETRWDPSVGIPGIRQMEYYQLFNARSNTFGARIEAMTMREPAPGNPTSLQKDFMVNLINVDGPGSTNTGAVQFNIGTTANSGASLTIKGDIVTATNANGAAGLTTYGGGTRSYDTSGTKYVDLFTLGSGNQYGAFLEGKDGNQVLTIDNWTNITFGNRTFFPDGTKTLPAIARAASTGTGLIFGSGYMGFVDGGTIQSRMDGANGISVNGADVIAWSTDSNFSAYDLSLAHPAAGVLNIMQGGYGATAFGSIVRKFEANSGTANTITSASTIAPTNQVSFVSGTTTIDTITAPAPITSTGGQITLIPTGAWATSTSGNVALATTAVVNKALILTYDHGTTKWYPSY